MVALHWCCFLPLIISLSTGCTTPVAAIQWESCRCNFLELVNFSGSKSCELWLFKDADCCWGTYWGLLRHHRGNFQPNSCDISWNQLKIIISIFDMELQLLDYSNTDTGWREAGPLPSPRCNLLKKNFRILESSTVIKSWTVNSVELNYHLADMGSQEQTWKRYLGKVQKVKLNKVFIEHLWGRWVCRKITIPNTFLADFWGVSIWVKRIFPLFSKTFLIKFNSLQTLLTFSENFINIILKGWVGGFDKNFNTTWFFFYL